MNLPLPPEQAARLLALAVVRVQKMRELASDETLLRLRDRLEMLGGKGSGNFGHKGRPGEVGGSADVGTEPGERPPASDNPKWAGWQRTYKPKAGDKKYERDDFTMIYSKGTDDAWSHEITVVDAKNKIIGSLSFGPHALEGRGKLEGAVQVHPEHRRKGMATAMYDLAESITKKKFIPAVSQTLRGEAFWKKRGGDPNYERMLGGAGSGNFGHAGRPGEVGGSSADGGLTGVKVESTGRHTVTISSDQGFITLLRTDDPTDRQVMVGDILVKPEERRKGYGTAIYEQALEYAISRGAPGLTSTGALSEDAKRMWAKFEKEGRVGENKDGERMLLPKGTGGSLNAEEVGLLKQWKAYGGTEMPAAMRESLRPLLERTVEGGDLAHLRPATGTILYRGDDSETLPKGVVSFSTDKDYVGLFGDTIHHFKVWDDTKALSLKGLVPGVDESEILVLVNAKIASRMRTLGDFEGHPFRGNQYTSGAGFNDDISSHYPIIDTMRGYDERDVKQVQAQLRQRGRLNADGTTSLYHVTLSDPESIQKRGLIPAFEAAPGQDWKAEHSSYATYFFLDKDHAIDQVEQTGVGAVIESRIPITANTLSRFVPDEDSSDDIHDGVKTLVSGGAVAFIGGVPPSSVKVIHRRGLGDFPGHPFRGNQWTAAIEALPLVHTTGHESVPSVEGDSVRNPLLPKGLEPDEDEITDYVADAYGPVAEEIHSATKESKGDVRTIPINRVDTQQATLSKAILKKYVGQTDPSKEDGIAIRYGRRFLLIDGNHRVVAKKIQGNQEVRLRVVSDTAKAKTLGDFEGHPFRGNQYTDAAGFLVDKSGNRLVAHHGSVSREVTAETLDPSREPVRQRPGQLNGLYFTSDLPSAHSYTRHPIGSPKRKEPAGRVVSAHLKAENPIDITNAIKAGQRKGLSFGDAKREALKLVTPEHDAVIFRGDGYNPDEYLVFSRKSIVPVRTLGGAGSGNFGHAGRPGEVGGSAPDNGTSAAVINAPASDWPAADDQVRSFVNDRQAMEGRAYRWKEEISQTEADAINHYTDRGFQEINMALRTGREIGIADTIEHAIEKAPPAPPPTLVWRGVNIGNPTSPNVEWKRAFIAQLRSLPEGSVIQLDGFQSTTISPFTAKEFGSTTSPFAKTPEQDFLLLEIKPKRGAPIEQVTFTSGENEFLMNHGSKYRVRGLKTVPFDGHLDKRQVLQIEEL